LVKPALQLSSPVKRHRDDPIRLETDFNRAERLNQSPAEWTREPAVAVELVQADEIPQPALGVTRSTRVIELKSVFTTPGAGRMPVVEVARQQGSALLA